MKIFGQTFYINFRSGKTVEETKTTFTKKMYRKAMILPHPYTPNEEEFRAGVQNAKNPSDIGTGARLVKTGKINWVVLFEALPNANFVKWEQIHTPIYCQRGDDKKTMICDVDVPN